MFEYRLNLYQKKWELEQAIVNANTEEEINAISW